jgi:hypothetical protein
MDITILNTNKERVHTLDTFSSLIWNELYSGYGNFEIYTPLNLSSYVFMQEDYYVTIPDSKKSMIIETRAIKTDKQHGDVLFVTGRSLESIITRRIVWAQTLLYGNLQNSIHTLFCDSIINATDETRRIPNFVFEDSTDDYILSLEADLQLYGDNLYTVVKEMCDIYGLGFELVFDSSYNFHFRLYNGVDRSYDQLLVPWVVFSPEYDNLLSSEYNVDKRYLKTVSLILGTGEGLERQAAVAALPGGAGTGLNRREIYTDGSDVAQEVNGVVLPPEEYENHLITKGSVSLSENVKEEYFEGEIDHEINFVFPRDFGLGDIVQIENQYGNVGKARVTEILRRIDQTGKRIYPTFTMIS